MPGEESAWDKADREEKERRFGPFGDRRVPWTVTDALVGVAIAWFLLIFIAGFLGRVPGTIGRYLPVLGSILGYAVFALVVWVIAIKIRGGKPSDLGIRKSPVLSAFIQAFVWWVIVRFLSGLYVVTLERLGIKPSVEQGERIVRLFGSGTLGLILAVVVAAIIAPIVEELLFRGFVYPAFRQAFGVALAIVFNGLVFALVHFDTFLFVPLAIIGFALAWLFEKNNALGPPILLHAINNLVSIGTLYYLAR